jgi:undecaprenyl-diphosphatase
VPNSPRKRPLVIVIVSCAVVVVVLAILVALRWTPLIDLDAATTTAAYHAALSTAWLRATAQGITVVGGPGVVDIVAALVVLPLVRARRWAPAIALATARIGELGIDSALKALLDRPRPVFAPPLATAPAASFPSGHAAGAAVLATVLFLLCARRWRFLIVTGAGPLTLAVAASRVVLGVHYPSDVVAGLALGIGCAAGAVLLTHNALTNQNPHRPDTWAS